MIEEYSIGKAGGKGVYKWINGEEYDGDWFNGYKHGKGIWKSNKGDEYIGDWVKGKAEGFGVHVWANGRIFFCLPNPLKIVGDKY